MIWEAGMAKTAADMVAEAKARVENLTVEQAAAEIEGGDALLIDIREPDEHTADGSIPDAVEGCLSSGPTLPARTTAMSFSPRGESSSTALQGEIRPGGPNPAGARLQQRRSHGRWHHGLERQRQAGRSRARLRALRSFEWVGPHRGGTTHPAKAVVDQPVRGVAPWKPKERWLTGARAT